MNRVGRVSTPGRAAPRLEGVRLFPFGGNARLNVGRLECLFEHGNEDRL